MKLLVFEYITGGGLAGKTMPAAIAAEGRMMLQALLDDLKSLPNLQLLLLLDDRCTQILAPPNTQVIWVRQTDDIKQLLPESIEQADLVWPIAPESRGVLFEIARQIKTQQKILLLSAPDTVSMCADKLSTYENLKRHSVAVVETRLLAGFIQSPFEQSVIKPRDGEGCEDNHIIENPAQFTAARQNLDMTRDYIVQPLVNGQSFSLSCLFKQGRGWLLCCNQQQIVIRNNQFSLDGCVVHVSNQAPMKYQNLVVQVAAAIPDLWGYIGIDFIEAPDQGIQILEINPRLTTSYVGIRQAIGINVAEQVLRLLHGDPVIQTNQNQSVSVVIH